MDTYQGHINHIVHGLFSLKTNRTTLKLQWTRKNCIYVSDTPVTLKQIQGQQTSNENVDAEQGYSLAKFERSRFIGVRGNANVKSFK